MNEQEAKQLLDDFRDLPAETEWLEFKEAKSQYDFTKLGKYFSALSNEANLKGKRYGWLIFGIEDKNRNIVGTNYRPNHIELEKLKFEIANKTANRLTFIEIHQLIFSEGRVLMFQIPAAPPGIPISFDGHYFGREGESLSPLNIQEIEEIRRQAVKYDWSAEVCTEANVNDLEPEAITKARIEFKKKFPKFQEDVDKWDDITFLNKAKITVKGVITRTAIILLGKEEAVRYLTPSVAKISWILKDEHNIERDYEHFGPPFLLNSDVVFSKIRNLKYRYMPDNTLFPIEVNQYDSYVIREALHNCIAHQDYELQGKINVVEKPDELIFTNLGNFIPQTVEAVIEQDAPQEYYRNRFLADAMVNLNMIDTIGSGIKKMFLQQRIRYFPLPDYDLSERDKVKVRILGKVLDENYTKMLINNTDLDLKTVILLDKVQKKGHVSQEGAKKLRNKKLVEGRYPNLYVTAEIAALTNSKSAYIKNRGLDKDFYKKMIVSLIEKYGSASRVEIDELLIEKLSDTLTYEQKRKKIGNILNEMSRKDNIIINTGSSKKPYWVLSTEKQK